MVAPLARWQRRPAWLADAWLGGSWWWQQTNNLGGAVAASTTGATQNDLAAVTTQGGFPIFSANYANGAGRSHLAADGTTSKYAFELNLPCGSRAALRGELAHQGIDLRRYDDAGAIRTAGPTAHLDGWGGYLAASAWVWRKVEISRFGHYDIPHWRGYHPPSPPSWGLMLAAKWDHVELAIGDLPPGGRARGHYALDTFELGANLWFTRHARLTANYALNYVGAGNPREAAALEQENIFFQQYEHELLFRLQVSL